jgi:hypothetical protein
MLGVFLGYYPYFRDPAYPLVGTDIYAIYALPAEKVLSSASWIVAASRERHPLVVLAIAVASRFLGLTVESLLRFAYIGLVLASGVAIFALVWVSTSSKVLASCSLLVATVSIPITIGIYTGIMAQWLALIVWVLSLSSLAFARSHDLRGYVLPIFGLGLGSVVVLFLHPWTWIAMMLGLIIYFVAAAMLRPEGASRSVGTILIVILFNTVALVLGLFSFPKAQGWRIAEAFSLVQMAFGSSYFGFGSWEIIVSFSRIWSQFFHPLTLILSILGVVVLARRRDRQAMIVLAWLAAVSIATIVAAPIAHIDRPVVAGSSEMQIFRATFLTPFQIPVAVGFLFLKSVIESRLGRSRGARAVLAIAGGVIFLAILNGALRDLFPLLTDPHNSGP